MLATRMGQISELKPKRCSCSARIHLRRLCVYNMQRFVSQVQTDRQSVKFLQNFSFPPLHFVTDASLSCRFKLWFTMKNITTQLWVIISPSCSNSLLTQRAAVVTEGFYLTTIQASVSPLKFTCLWQEKGKKKKKRWHRNKTKSPPLLWWLPLFAREGWKEKKSQGNE